MKKISLFSIFVLLILISCTVLPWVKDINNIFDWISVPKENTEYRFMERRKDFSGDTWNTDYTTYTIIDIDEYADEKVMTIKDDNNDLFYIIADKQEGGIATSNDTYYDKYVDFVFLRTPIEKGTKWYTDDYNFEIDDMNQSKTVEAGTFNDCIIIKYSGGNIVSGEMYYSPSKGIWVYIHELYTYDREYIAELDDIRQ